MLEKLLPQKHNRKYEMNEADDAHMHKLKTINVYATHMYRDIIFWYVFLRTMRYKVHFGLLLRDLGTESN